MNNFGWETAANVHETSNPPEGTPADTTTRDKAVEYLDSHNGTDPFFLTVSFNLPHPMFYEDPGFSEWYERDAVTVPKSYTDDLSDKPAFHRERARGPEGKLTEAEIRDIRYKYRTMVSRLDDHVGRVLDALGRNGFRDETIVLFTSDHGDMQGAHRLNKKGVIAYDEILRIPLVIDIPGRTSRRETIPDLCSLAAVPSTLLEAAELPTDAVGGESLLSAFDRPTPPDDETVFFEHKYAYWGEHPYRGVRTRRWKYVEYMTDNTDELYDMIDDPHEIHNLAGNSEYVNIAGKLRQQVRDWWERTDGDDETWNTPINR